MAIIAIPKILTERLTDEGARALADMFKEVETSAHQNILQSAEDRFERRLTEEISQLRMELRVEIQTTRADLIKWMFIFWIGQAATTLGIVFAFLKH